MNVDCVIILTPHTVRMGNVYSIKISHVLCVLFIIQYSHKHMVYMDTMTLNWFLYIIT